ncbi:cation diffusion facilitator family transporter [Acidithiobacillus ferridurans]|uniref:cation diffusion facilitator family transporter n=1 Tax=Acidithiobacillus ferridurans TaxID=1232575 RepID=UPI001C077158|nr:cation diffusion facilitator family transporter [Acidithiobacillus ferridurans]MBU2734008.1 cation transporter [Acidithiobacillus ferridurans]
MAHNHTDHAESQHTHAPPHDHGHRHGAHGHAPVNGRAFAIGIGLNLSFVLTEAVFGVLGHSLALLADAGHNLSDVLGLLMAWGASALANRPPSGRFTYGLRSSSILAALANAVFLLVVTGGIAWEAIERLLHPAAVASVVVIGVAAFGVVVNTGTALLFMSGRKGDLNIRAAFLHMAGDAAISLGVVVAGIVMLFTHWFWLDSATSLLISALIVMATWGLLRDSAHLALHGVPPGIDIDAVRVYLLGIPNVTAVHDLHIWAMSTTETALTAHLVMPDGYPGDALFHEIGEELRAHFQIVHPTLQVETGDPGHPCKLAGEHLV